MTREDIITNYGDPVFNLYIGDLVVIKDGSYIMSIMNDSFKLENSHHLGLSDEVLQIIAINVACPSDNFPQLSNNSLRPSNNCILKSLLDNSIHFCSRINITKVKIDDLGSLDRNNINLQTLRESRIDSILK